MIFVGKPDKPVFHMLTGYQPTRCITNISLIANATASIFSSKYNSDAGVWHDILDVNNLCFTRDNMAWPQHDGVIICVLIYLFDDTH